MLADPAARNRRAYVQCQGGLQCQTVETGGRRAEENDIRSRDRRSERLSPSVAMISALCNGATKLTDLGRLYVRAQLDSGKIHKAIAAVYSTRQPTIYACPSPSGGFADVRPATRMSYPYPPPGAPGTSPGPL